MATNFPSSLDTSTTIPAEGASIPLSTNHVTAHQNIQDAIEVIEAKIGVDSSAVTTSHDYKLSGVTGSDKAVSKTGSEVLTNKTLTSPVVNVGSDATGDMYYRNAGVLTRIAIGTDNQILKLNGTTPNWETESVLFVNNEDIAYGSGNKTVTQTGFQNNAERYAADAGANDTYVITLSPAPISYKTGMVVYFKANTANTEACTLNVNSLGAKTIKKGLSTTLADGDIAAGMFCTVIYDGTDFILQNPTNAPKSSNAKITISTSTTTTITLGYRPKKITLHGSYSPGSGWSNGIALSNGGYDVSTASMWCQYLSTDTNGSVSGGAISTSIAFNMVHGTAGGNATSATIGNITDTGFDIVSTVAGGGRAYDCAWTAIG